MKKVIKRKYNRFLAGTTTNQKSQSVSDSNSDISDDIDEKLQKTKAELTAEKEKKFLNLIIEIIVSSTLRSYYEKSN